MTSLNTYSSPRSTGRLSPRAIIGKRQVKEHRSPRKLATEHITHSPIFHQGISSAHNISSNIKNLKSPKSIKSGTHTKISPIKHHTSHHANHNVDHYSKSPTRRSLRLLMESTQNKHDTQIFHHQTTNNSYQTAKLVEKGSNQIKSSVTLKRNKKKNITSPKKRKATNKVPTKKRISKSSKSSARVSPKKF
ncbi:uncharacterized protein CMU_008610 [Cryptosporidium muris RN66]|uniref:Uncharacterized protein n=1 Tax=Cryptosporidium muris (strain RN66) TaxID=441375 RepID=B6ADS9_CRYMR|nr:uncharacterized protein CMU_008610 [Cryptosporidium muris RN66]EEA06370.1 hypothetical protein CMU_008610 [Cryptosporidium muris RN66]|eukprot:XP_002140719.1 hypothetical protein [Cryptosporidium muris RN66]